MGVAVALAGHDPTDAALVLAEARKVAGSISSGRLRSEALVGITVALAEYDPTNAARMIAAVALGPGIWSEDRALVISLAPDLSGARPPIIEWVRRNYAGARRSHPSSNAPVSEHGTAPH